MGKLYKPPVNNRSAIVRIASPETIEIDASGEALLQEAPADPSLYAMTVTVGGVARTRVTGAPVAGQYRVKTDTVVGPDGLEHTVYLPVLVFHSSDANASGTADYYLTGTIVTAEFYEALKAFLSPLTGYASVEDLTAGVPPTMDTNTRGRPADMALLSTGELVVSDGTAWQSLSLSGALLARPAAAWAKTSGVDPVIVMDSMIVVPSAAWARTLGEEPAVEVALAGLTLSPAAAYARALGADPSVVHGALSLSPSAGYSIAVSVNPMVTGIDTDINENFAASLGAFSEAVATVERHTEGADEVMWVHHATNQARAIATIAQSRGCYLLGRIRMPADTPGLARIYISNHASDPTQSSYCIQIDQWYDDETAFAWITDVTLWVGVPENLVQIGTLYTSQESGIWHNYKLELSAGGAIALKVDDTTRISGSNNDTTSFQKVHIQKMSGDIFVDSASTGDLA